MSIAYNAAWFWFKYDPENPDNDVDALEAFIEERPEIRLYGNSAKSTDPGWLVWPEGENHPDKPSMDDIYVLPDGTLARFDPVQDVPTNVPSKRWVVRLYLFGSPHANFHFVEKFDATLDQDEIAKLVAEELKEGQGFHVGVDNVGRRVGALNDAVMGFVIDEYREQDPYDPSRYGIATTSSSGAKGAMAFGGGSPYPGGIVEEEQKSLPIAVPSIHKG